MSSSFPTGLDNLSNPGSSDKMNSVGHAAQHANANDAIEALQVKVGIDGSADPDSLEYRLTNLETTTSVEIGTQGTGTSFYHSKSGETIYLKSLAVAGQGLSIVSQANQVSLTGSFILSGTNIDEYALPDAAIGLLAAPLDQTIRVKRLSEGIGIDLTADDKTIQITNDLTAGKGVWLATTGDAIQINSGERVVDHISLSTGVDMDNDVCLVDTSAGDVTITLPNAAENEGLELTVKKLKATNELTIATTGTQTIDDESSLIITTQYTSVSMVSDGTNWHIL